MTHENFQQTEYFFDTNIFNAVLESSPIIPKTVKVVSCPQVLAELADTSQKNPERAKKLCDLFFKLVEDRVVRPALELAKEEIICLRNNVPPPSPYFSEEGFQSRFLPTLHKFVSGDFSDVFLPRLKKMKAQFRDELREIYSSLDSTARAPQIPFVLYNLERMNIHASPEVAGYIIEQKRRVPHFWVLIEMGSALQSLYDQTKPKWGINVDMQIIWNCTAFEHFVTHDTDSAALFQILFPEKRVIKLSDII